MCSKQVIVDVDGESCIRLVRLLCAKAHGQDRLAQYILESILQAIKEVSTELDLDKVVKR